MSSIDRTGGQRRSLLDLRVIRSTANRDRFWWLLREVDGRFVDASAISYASEAEARRAANAAVRTIHASRTHGA